LARLIALPLRIVLPVLVLLTRLLCIRLFHCQVCLRIVTG
jgi:hypothetical protein